MWSRLKTWLAAAGAALAAVALALAYGWSRGRRQVRTQYEAETARRTSHEYEVRQDVETTNQALPDAPEQRVGDAAPGTAAGRLRKRWIRR